MIWLMAVRRISTKLVNSPFTETFIEGANSVIYEPGIEPIAYTGADGTGDAGEFSRGVNRISGMVFSHDGAAAEALFAIEQVIDLKVYYTGAKNEKRIRTIKDILFVGDAEVIVPGDHEGISQLIGVPFRAQFADGEKLADKVSDAAE